MFDFLGGKSHSTQANPHRPVHTTGNMLSPKRSGPMLHLRSFLFNVIFYALIAVAAFLILPVFVLPRRTGWPVVRLWARINLFLLRVIVGLDIEVRGRENIPEGGVLVASKHQSAWETFALVPLFRDPTYILKRELLWLPFFGWYAWRFGMIPVNRGRGSAVLPDLTRKVRAALDTGRQVIIFPEGTRRAPGAEPAYKFGIAFLYSHLDCPVLPIALNSGLYWPRRRSVRHPGRIIVDILPPIPAGIPTREFREELTDQIEDASNRLLKEASEATPAPPLPPEAKSLINTTKTEKPLV